MIIRFILLQIILLFSIGFCHGQDVSLFQQFNGRFDFVAIGNTMNTEENGPSTNCTILTSSMASLNLSPEQEIQAAYLYWSGSGSGDFEVTLNGIAITAERMFSYDLDATRNFFAAFTEVTSILLEQGNGDYTLSDLDLTSVISPFCPTGTNFAGWTITIIYGVNNLPLNQINVYDGLQNVLPELTIVLENLNVLDNQGAKIGFIAWEGDQNLAVNESLTINGNIIGNPPLNPSNNAFNGTNSFTSETDAFNMDIDFYDIQNTIDIGDTTATIQLTSGQDFVLINNIITVLNSQLPDATVNIDDTLVQCNNTQVELQYTVNNLNSTAVLPAGLPITFYLNNILIDQSSTQNDIPIGESETNIQTITSPILLEEDFEIEIVVNDDGTGNTVITEINVDNNSDSVIISPLLSDPLIVLPSQIGCDEGFNMTRFDLSENLDNISSEFDTSTATYYLNQDDANLLQNEILNPESYINASSPEEIYIRIEHEPCFQLFVLQLVVENCPPQIPQGFSPNNDGFNDWFNIQGLYDIFEDHNLLIYNRYGTLVFSGNNELKWLGKANEGINAQGKLVPVGTYFYVLQLNDPDFKPLTGWVYVNY